MSKLLYVFVALIPLLGQGQSLVQEGKKASPRSQLATVVTDTDFEHVDVREAIRKPEPPVPTIELDGDNLNIAVGTMLFTLRKSDLRVITRGQLP